MAGLFTPGTLPALAGSYWNYEADVQEALPPSTGGIVVAPATSNWGPINEIIKLDTFDAYSAIFGTSDTPLRRAVYGAFKGEGRDGHPGAGTVFAYRQAHSDAAAATKVLANTTPATALTLTARYKGTRANNLRVTTQDSASGGKTDLIILDGALVVETFTFTSTSMTAAVSLINSKSGFVTAVAGTNGVKLASVTASAFTGGDDGATLDAGDWLDMQDTLDSEKWALIAAYDLTDSDILAAFTAWIKQRNTLGSRSMAVVGGAADEDLSDANARAVLINDWDVVNLGVGTLHLDDLGADASTAEFTVRVAGAIANRGESRDMFFVRFSGVSLVTAPTLSDEEEALASGTTVFSRDTNAIPVFIRESVTSYSDDSQSPVDGEGNKKYPVALYKRIKNLRIQHAIELAVDEWATSGDVLGTLPVNDRSRSLVLGFLKGEYQSREDAEIVQPGWTVVITTPTSDDDDFFYYTHGFHPTRSSRQLLNTVRMG